MPVTGSAASTWFRQPLAEADGRRRAPPPAADGLADLVGGPPWSDRPARLPAGGTTSARSRTPRPAPAGRRPSESARTVIAGAPTLGAVAADAGSGSRAEPRCTRSAPVPRRPTGAHAHGQGRSTHAGSRSRPADPSDGEPDRLGPVPGECARPPRRWPSHAGAGRRPRRRSWKMSAPGQRVISFQDLDRPGPGPARSQGRSSASAAPGQDQRRAGGHTRPADHHGPGRTGPGRRPGQRQPVPAAPGVWVQHDGAAPCGTHVRRPVIGDSSHVTRICQDVDGATRSASQQHRRRPARQCADPKLIQKA